MKLSAKVIEHLTSEGRPQREVPDDATPGLLLIVSATGAKTFVVRYSLARKRRRVTLGRWPDLPYREARERAAEIMTRVARREDPAAGGGPSTVAAAFDLYWPARRETLKRPNEDLRIWSAFIAPTIGGLDLDRLGPLDGDRLLSAWRAAGLGTGQRNCWRVVKHFEGWAVDRRLCLPWLPRRAVLPAPTVRGAAPPLEAVRGLWAASEGLPANTRDALRLLILTAARRSMAERLEWSEVDLAGARLVFPAGRMKAGRAFAAPLCPTAVSILSSRRRHADVVFASKARDRSGGMVPARPRWPEILRGCGWPFRLHDLRSAFASWAVGVGTEPHVVAACLDHSPEGSSGRITAVYIRFGPDRFWPERVALAARWEAAVTS